MSRILSQRSGDTRLKHGIERGKPFQHRRNREHREIVIFPE
jgi:hypothetical protein